MMVYNLLAFIVSPLDSVWSIYTLLAGLLVLSGAGLPLPEEITLIFGGYLAYLGTTEFWPTVWTLIAGIMLADIVGYWEGRLAGQWIQERVLSRSRWCAALAEKTKGYFRNHGGKTVFFSRALLGVRVLVPILAGHFRMPFVKFLALDALTAIPWTLALVFASYYLGSGLDLITEVREIKIAILAILGFAVSCGALVRFIRTRNGPREQTKDYDKKRESSTVAVH
ncbi:MAG: DedA family protein [Candidatus Sungbacteria bacterium]|nr:DedA family protein [Candidatus Sungbacteria bacterium]